RLTSGPSRVVDQHASRPASFYGARSVGRDDGVSVKAARARSKDSASPIEEEGVPGYRAVRRRNPEAAVGGGEVPRRKPAQAVQNDAVYPFWRDVESRTTLARIPKEPFWLAVLWTTLPDTAIPLPALLATVTPSTSWPVPVN